MTKAENTTSSTFIVECSFSKVVPPKYAIQNVAKRADS